MQKKVLIVRFSALGDLLLTTGPLAQLRQSFPSLSIDLLTSDIGSEIYLNSIEIDNTIILPKGSSLGQIIGLYRQMEKYDVIIDWQGNLKSYLLKLFQRAPFYSIEKQSRERRAFVSKRKYQQQLNQHVVQKYYATLKKAFPELPDLELEELRPLFLTQNLISSENFDLSKSIVIHPYASQRNKEWSRFPQLIEALIQQNKSVVIVGQDSNPLSIPESPQVLNLTNKTNLREMAAVIHQGQMFISTDSGPMHMGVAVKTPTLALFGPTTKEFGFYPQFKHTHVVETQLDCRPCHVHGGNECPLQHHKCMQDITVEMVKKAITSLEKASVSDK